jgi:hypothetical protein
MGLRPLKILLCLKDLTLERIPIRLSMKSFLSGDAQRQL